jgi:hypothetical protein
MRKTIPFLFLITFFPSFLHAQQDPDPLVGELPCGTNLTQQQLDYLNTNLRDRQNFHYFSGNKSITYVPVQSHIVRRSNSTGGLTAVELSNILLTLNHYYLDADIQFYECGPVNFIDDDSFFDFSSSDEGLIGSANDVTNVINIYYFNSVLSGSSAVCGYSRFPPSVDRVIMDNSCALNGSTIVHELGHYFSLYHTHGKTNTGTTNELVNGSNCTIAGDDVCDTPADPNLSGVVSATCGYTGTATDANGQAYIPQANNIMSYSRKSCRRLITPGQYSRIVFSLMNDRSYLLCNPAAPVTDFVSNTQVSCQGTIHFNDRSTSLPSSWVWDFGDGSTSTSRNPSHTYTTSGTYNVSLTSANSSGSDQKVKSSYVTVNLPSPPIAASTDTICDGDTAVLLANGNGTLYWYDTAQGGNVLTMGNSLRTAPLNGNVTYYVEDRIPNLPQTVGPLNTTFGGGGNYTNKRYLEFDAFKPFRLQAVTVEANGAKVRTFELRNFLGLVLQDTSIFVNNGQQVVHLNFDVPAETDLQLGLSVTSEVDLYRNTSGVSYPYQLPGLLSIKGSSGGSSNYYFFYNWQVLEDDCISQRVSVTVPVKNCAVGVDEQIALHFSIYPNPTTGHVFVEGNWQNKTSIRIFNLLGREVQHSFSSSQREKIDISAFPGGIYFIKITSGDTEKVEKIVLR